MSNAIARRNVVMSIVFLFTTSLDLDYTAMKFLTGGHFLCNVAHAPNMRFSVNFSDKLLVSISLEPRTRRSKCNMF